ncbi:protein PXR1-like [Miscanthus floridulus]|uniref:protein PXR1-like n=1 Tax=Miscanthus floridulus TaxID=154761 RepID=UPI0034576FFA
MARGGCERCKDEDKALFGDEKIYSSSQVCGFKSVLIEPKRKGRVDQDEKKDEDKKKKSVTFKANTSSKSKGKAKKEESSDDEEASGFDMESMAVFVKNFGKFMKKKGYKSRKIRDNFKNKDQVRRCFRCKSKDHILADCPYNSDNEEDEKKTNKKEKKEKEKKMSFKK